MGLKKLAKLVFQLTRYEVWLGGKTSYKKAPGWPTDIDHKWDEDVYWTLSPEVELRGLQVQVCVSSKKPRYNETFGTHQVRVFIDKKLIHPGGTYTRISVPWWWSTPIAVQEREEGGEPGPVDIRKLLIRDAQGMVSGVKVENPPLIPEMTPELRKALLEVEGYDQEAG